MFLKNLFWKNMYKRVDNLYNSVSRKIIYDSSWRFVKFLRGPALCNLTKKIPS